MCPIDIPYAYVQQISTSQHLFTQNFSKPEKNTKTEQSELHIKYLTNLFENVNENLYPMLLEQLDMLSDKEVETLKSQLQSKEFMSNRLAEIKALRLAASSPSEKKLFKAFEVFIKNHLNLVIALEEGVVILSPQEEEAIQNMLAENHANPAERVQGWDNIVNLFA